MQQQRNFDHLEYDENLYDFMKAQIPFFIQSLQNQHVNQYVLNDGRGLEKHDVLNLYYNDPVGKREFVNELLLSTLLPKQWGASADRQRDLPSAQELGAVLIDVQGSFSVYKFVERVRAFYDTQQLYETLEPGEARAETEDKHQFIRTVLQNLHVFSVYSAAEFNLAVRSLANFLKTHKNIGLVVVDGTHLIENVEIYAVKNSDKFGSGAKAPKTNNIQTMAAHGDVPTSDDFFGGAAAPTKAVPQPSASLIRQSFTLRRGGKMGSRIDFSHFDSKLIERALALLQDFKRVYQFAVINCMARPNLRRTADLLEAVMTRGLQPEQIPKPLPKDFQEGAELPEAPLMEGQVQGANVDHVLREAVKSLRANEILLLRGDRQNSLMPRDPKKIHESLMSQHLTCCIVPQHFRFRDGVANTYIKRFLALYILYKINVNLYSISDDVAKAFYL